MVSGFHSYILSLVSSVSGFHKCLGFLGFMVSLVSWFHRFRGFTVSWFPGSMGFLCFVVS